LCHGYGITDTDSQLVQRSQDVGVAPQQAGDKDAEQQNDKRRYNDKSDHSVSFSAATPSVFTRTGSEERHSWPAFAGGSRCLSLAVACNAANAANAGNKDER
jgi:hypothetical protein